MSYDIQTGNLPDHLKADKTGGIIVQVIGYFVALSLLLLFYFFHKKLRKTRKQSSPKEMGQLESKFYHNSPRFVKFMDNISIKGIGTKFFTLHKLEPDGSYEGIKWITIAYMPIFPLYQERINQLVQKKKNIIPFALHLEKEDYQIIKRLKLDIKMVRRTFIMTYGLFLPFMLIPLPFVIAYRKLLATHFEGPKFWIVLLVYLFWGILIFALMEYWNNKYFLKRKNTSLYSKD